MMRFVVERFNGASSAEPEGEFTSATLPRPEAGIVATHIPPALGYGGVPATAGILTKAWTKLGHSLMLAASDESIAGRLLPSQVRFGPRVGVHLYRAYGFKRWGFGFGAIPCLLRLVWESPVVYVHGIATWPTTLAALFCAVLRRPFMVAVHGGMMPEHVAFIRRAKPFKWLFYNLLTFPILRRAIAIHCTSDTEAQGVRDLLGGNARILLVPNGIDPADYEVADCPPGKGISLCFLGHIQREKGINAFIRAWLKCRGPYDRLVVAGRGVDGPYFNEFKDLLKAAGGSITYLGYVPREKVREALAECHFLVLPSGLEAAGGMRENFGNVVAEAMACGRPVLVAKGLAWDQVESLETGWAFDRNESSVREVIIKALRVGRPDWERMSNNARRYVTQNLDDVALARQVWDALVAKDSCLLAQPSERACGHD